MNNVKLNPGDLVTWVAPGHADVQLLVAENGTDLWFQFAPKPWHKLKVLGVEGLTVQQAQEVLSSPSKAALDDFGIPGWLYKSWDEERSKGHGVPDWIAEKVEEAQANPEPVGKVERQERIKAPGEE